MQHTVLVGLVWRGHGATFVATRTASENDVVIDICGVMVVIAICWMTESGKQERGKRPA